jgi:hypothetical protein
MPAVVLAQLQTRARKAARTPWPYLVTACALGAFASHQVLRRAGAPAVPLDDAYIHFQFARSFAQGKPFVYSPGTAPVAGATSLLWPLLLSIPQLCGVAGLALIPWAWLFGWLCLAGLAYDTARAAARITSDGIAALCGLAVLAFSANAWFATSGMEVVPLGWILIRTARRSAEWFEGDRSHRRELIALAWLGPLMRPEGSLATMFVVSALIFGERPAARRALQALAALVGVLVPACLNLLLTGHATQTTALVKWLPLNPYLHSGEVLGTMLDNAQIFFGTLLDGKVWSAVFVPQHARILACCALPALLYAGSARGVSSRAWLLTALGLGILIPTSYDSFLWNRLRYLWPFAAPWLIGLGALCDQLGELAARLSARLGLARYALMAGLIGALASKYPFALWDLAESCAAISAQHVELGKWAKTELPPDARIGVNDTGAIAYFSQRPVFDIVGLTTPGEAQYWVAGAGSRFEHYEHLPRSALPTHFIVYPGWLAIDSLLGECLEERTVSATILGGTTMLACRADYSSLGSAERPLAAELAEREPLDVLDVADLESEAAHGYARWPGAQGDDIVVSDGERVDGARRNRTCDSFTLRVAPGALLVARLGASGPTRVTVRVDGQLVRDWALRNRDFQELSSTLPTSVKAGVSRVEVSAEVGERFSAAHFWIYR